tara:strand:+ start:172 stop:387 length:216 start_codon:yes stop_codon:yes gene_type:complete
MANLELTMDDVQELFRTMPEAFRQVQMVAQARVIRELEEKVTSLEGGSNAESGEEALPVHTPRKAAGKGGS